MKFWTNFLCLLLLLGACKRDTPLAEEEVAAKVPESLPMKGFPLNDLSAFVPGDGNWRLSAAVFADLNMPYDLQTEEGSGVLVNTQNGNASSHLATQMQHGDLEMELEFLLPKNGKAHLLLQGLYAIHFEDSWNKKENTCGMLLGNTADANQLAPVNACRAPGLWQELSLYFQAPRFDTDGNKISHAKIIYLKLNGYTLFEDIEWTAPSIGATGQKEAAEGPLVFSTLEGPVAFQSIQYKAYTQDSLKVENIRYKLYQGSWDKLPELDTLPVAKSGQQEDFSVVLKGQKDKYAMAFTADLIVPVDGDYLFATLIDDGGDLSIDGQLVVHNDGEPGVGVERGIVHLTEGTHPLTLTYYQDVWGKLLTIYYEGPNIKRGTLGSIDRFNNRRRPKPKIVNPEDGPELIRGFVNYKGVKRNTPISVGSPQGIHYSYDLDEGALLQAWRGDYADVTNMWVGRGKSQLLIPANASMEVSGGVPIARLSSPSMDWPADLPDGFVVEGYDIDADGFPVFRYRFNNTVFTDQILPTPEGYLERSIKVVEGQVPADLYLRLAEGKIEALESGWFRLDGHYYIALEEGEIAGLEHGQLLVPLAGKSSVQYTLIW